MKNYKWLIIALLCVTGCTSQKEAVFLKASVRYHYQAENGEEALFFPFTNEAGNAVKLTGIRDYKADVKVDPYYMIDSETALQDKNFYTYGLQLPMLKNMKAGFTTISYLEDNEEKTADIGIYEIEKRGKGIEEISISRNYEDEKKREVYIDLNIEKQGVLKKVEAVNPDMQVRISFKSHKDEEIHTNTRVTLHYELPETYDMVAKNFCYTFVKNGIEEQRYGRGNLLIYKNGDIISSRGFLRSSV